MKIDVILDDYDSRLMLMYHALYPDNRVACYGQEWIINTTEDTIEFKTYKSFINSIENEVKQVLFNYAFDGMLDEIAFI